MKSFTLLFLVLFVLPAHATSAAVQDAFDLDDEALSNRVKQEIDALVTVGDKARAEREAVEDTIASLKEARAAARAPLPTDPGETAGLATLSEQSLLIQVQLREQYLTAYRTRKQQLDRIPGLSDTRRTMIDHAMEAVRSTEQRAGDLGPLLAELARRIKAGRMSADAALLDDDGVDGWMAMVERHLVESAAWLATYGPDGELPEDPPPPVSAETVWNLDTERSLQHSLDVAGVLLQAAGHEAAERDILEKTDHAALGAVIARIHDDWRLASAEYERALDRARIKRAALAGLDADRRDLTPPS